MKSFLHFLPLNKIFRNPKKIEHTSDNLYYEYNQCIRIGSGLDDQWFVRFLRHHFPGNKTIINFYGTLGEPFYIRNPFPGKKVFYTPEDVEHPRTRDNLLYGDYCLDYVDLAMGFGEVDHTKYLRFPYWILTTFSPDSDEESIRRRIESINNTRYTKTQDCVLINGHDTHGTREMIYNGVKDILDVKFAGHWRNNTDELWTKYKDNKELYMRNFKFNICAENDNTKNYVTEKLFDAFISDCIPLYYGSYNDPEPGLINRDAVIFWKKENNNEENRVKVLKLKNNEKFYQEFISQPKLLPAMEEYVIDRYVKLKNHFAQILS